MTAGERIFRALLRAYPRRFRNRFRDEMLDVFREDQRRDDVRWLRVLADTAVGVVAQHVREVRRSVAQRRSRSDDFIQNDHFDQGDSMIAIIWQDIRYALRGIVRQPAFSLIVVATLALGIGANTAIFSVVKGILLEKLPYPDSDRIVHFVHEQPYSSVSEEEFIDYKRDMRTFEQLAAYNSGEVSVVTGDEALRVMATRVATDFFPILGVKAQLGRVFSEDEYKPNGPRVVVISHGLWQSQFGGDSSIIGKELKLSSGTIPIIGVLPEKFDFPSAATGMWFPMRLDEQRLSGRNNHFMQMIGRLAPNASTAAARAEANTLAAQWQKQYRDIYGNDVMTSRIQTLQDSITGGTRPFLLALLGAVGFVLLIACVNVANLFLARGEARRKEVAIRSALGASHNRLSAQLVTESMLYALAGGVLGVLVAYSTHGILIAAAPPSIPRLDEVTLDGAVLAFSAVITLATGALFGLYPAMRVARGHTAQSLREGTRTSTAGGASALRRVMVVAEVALAVVMLAGAGVMLRSLWKLQNMDMGFDASRVFTAQVSLPSQYAGERGVAFYDNVVKQLAALPGVTSAGAIRMLPISEGGSRWSIMIDNIEIASIGDSPSAAPQQLTPDALKTLSIGLVDGRGFTEQDRMGAPMVVLVNEALAEQLWKGANPIGRTIKMFNATASWATVVGLVKDTRAEGLIEDVPPTMYFPHAQSDSSNYSSALTMSLVVKTTGDPSSVASSLRSIVRSIDASVPVTRTRPLDEIVSESIAGRQFSTTLLAAFAALALLLAGLGIYGVIAFNISQRTSEIGLRVALGAQRTSVIGLVLKQSLVMTAIGLGIGFVGAVVVTQTAKSMLVGVASYDPITFVAVAVSIVAVALLAGLVPARRALRVSPLVALQGSE